MILRVFLMICCWMVLSTPVFAAKRDVWIDADPACGLARSDDVDDCWALVAAMRAPGLNVVAISTVFGNVSHEKASGVASDLLAEIARSEKELKIPPLFSGSQSPVNDDVDLPEAVHQLASALRQRSMTLLALGPLTNVALLLKTYPELAHRIEAIIAIAGQRPGQVFKVGKTPVLHFHDLNFRKDPDAFDIILRSGVAIHLVPFEAGRQVSVMPSDLDRLEAQGGLDLWIAKRSIGWLRFWQDTLGASGFSPFDTLGVAYLLAPQHFSCSPLPAKLIRRRGIFANRDSLEVSNFASGSVLVNYCWGVSQALSGSMADFVSSPASWRAKHP